jgi:ABC-type Fe3+-hydroxamate transport system substrate-binding protein
MPRLGRVRTAVVAISLATAVLVSGCGSSSTPAAASSAAAVKPSGGSGSPAPGVQVISVTYSGGVITPPEGRVVVALGHKVEIRVTSDVAEIVHNHFNNVEQDVAPGGTVVFDFTADKPGIYEVELHKSNKLLLELQVQ